MRVIAAIPNFSDYYIDKYGNIFSTKHSKIPKPRKIQINKFGYKYIHLSKNNKKYFKMIHRLMLMTFIPCKDMHNLQVNHIDCNKQNNNLNNLEWCTHLENVQHAYRNNLIPAQKGSKNGYSKLKETNIIDIREASKNGETSRKIAERFEISARTIRNIISKKTWRHVI